MSATKKSLIRMTPKALVESCKKNKLYLTPHLNDVLYLHFSGYEEIECLEPYTGLKCIWLESNAIGKISGLDNQKDLKCLFLQQNLVKKIENLENCASLDTLNLSHNYINKIENCGTDVLPVLSTLNLSHNYLRTLDNVQNLADCVTISVLDLGHNRIEDVLIVKVLGQMMGLRVLVLTGNPVVNSIPNYRKTLILECESLTNLDNRPVFDRDRAAAVAWKRGGYEAERKVHQKFIRREQNKIRRSVNSTLCLRRKFTNSDDPLITLLSTSEEESTDDEQKESGISTKKKPKGDKEFMQQLGPQFCDECFNWNCVCEKIKNYAELFDEVSKSEEVNDFDENDEVVEPNHVPLTKIEVIENKKPDPDVVEFISEIIEATLDLSQVSLELPSMDDNDNVSVINAPDPVAEEKITKLVETNEVVSEEPIIIEEMPKIEGVFYPGTLSEGTKKALSEYIASVSNKNSNVDNETDDYSPQESPKLNEEMTGTKLLLQDNASAENIKDTHIENIIDNVANEILTEMIGTGKNSISDDPQVFNTTSDSINEQIPNEAIVTDAPASPVPTVEPAASPVPTMEPPASPVPTVEPPPPPPQNPQFARNSAVVSVNISLEKPPTKKITVADKYKNANAEQPKNPTHNDDPTRVNITIFSFIEQSRNSQLESTNDLNTPEDEIILAHQVPDDINPNTETANTLSNNCNVEETSSTVNSDEPQSKVIEETRETGIVETSSPAEVCPISKETRSHATDPPITRETVSQFLKSFETFITDARVKMNQLNASCAELQGILNQLDKKSPVVPRNAGCTTVGIDELNVNGTCSDQSLQSVDVQPLGESKKKNNRVDTIERLLNAGDFAKDLDLELALGKDEEYVTEEKQKIKQVVEKVNSQIDSYEGSVEVIDGKVVYFPKSDASEETIN